MPRLCPRDIIPTMMRIHLIKAKATAVQIEEMLEALESYVKLAVDVRRGVLAGGGMLHADCEAVLLKDGSKQEDIWGADWLLDSKEVRFEALINIRPKQNNRSMTIEDTKIRNKIKEIVENLLGK